METMPLLENIIKKRSQVDEFTPGPDSKHLFKLYRCRDGNESHGERNSFYNSLYSEKENKSRSEAKVEFHRIGPNGKVANGFFTSNIEEYFSSHFRELPETASDSYFGGLYHILGKGSNSFSIVYLNDVYMIAKLNSFEFLDRNYRKEDEKPRSYSVFFKRRLLLSGEDYNPGSNLSFNMILERDELSKLLQSLEAPYYKIPLSGADIKKKLISNSGCTMFLYQENAEEDELNDEDYGKFNTFSWECRRLEIKYIDVEIFKNGCCNIPPEVSKQREFISFFSKKEKYKWVRSRIMLCNVVKLFFVHKYVEDIERRDENRINKRFDLLVRGFRKIHDNESDIPIEGNVYAFIKVEKKSCRGATLSEGHYYVDLNPLLFKKLLLIAELYIEIDNCPTLLSATKNEKGEVTELYNFEREVNDLINRIKDIDHPAVLERNERIDRIIEETKKRRGEIIERENSLRRKWESLMEGKEPYLKANEQLDMTFEKFDEVVENFTDKLKQELDSANKMAKCKLKILESNISKYTQNKKDKKFKEEIKSLFKFLSSYDNKAREMNNDEYGKIRKHGDKFIVLVRDMVVNDKYFIDKMEIKIGEYRKKLDIIEKKYDREFKNLKIYYVKSESESRGFIASDLLGFKC